VANSGSVERLKVQLGLSSRKSKEAEDQREAL
jgi:hypothetical protein